MWILAGSIGGILVRIILPLGLMARFTYLNIILKVLLFSVLAIGGWFKWELFHVILCYSLVELMYAWGIFWYIKKIMPEFYPWWRYANTKTGWINFKHSLVLTMNGLLDQFSNNGLILVISSFLSAKAIPLFTTMRTVANTALIGTNTFLTSVAPDLIRLHANNEKQKLRQIFFANWFITGLPINVVFLFLPIFAERLYTWWTKGQIAFDMPLLLLLLAGVVLTNFFKGFALYLFFINDIKINFTTSVIKATIIILITIGGIMKFGLYAPAVGYIIAETVTGIIIFRKANSHLEKGSSSFSISDILLAFVPIIIVLSLFVCIGLNNTFPIWMIFTGFLFLISSYIIILKKNGEYLLQRFKVMTKRKIN